VHAGDQASEHKTTGADDNDADGAALLREKSWGCCRYGESLKGRMIATLSSSIGGSKQQGGKRRINGPPPQPTLPAVREAILRTSSLG
jgi:hypothetical protein